MMIAETLLRCIVQDFKKQVYEQVCQCLVLLGMSMMECSEACDTGERTRATLIICPLSVLSNWIVSLKPFSLKWDVNMFVCKNMVLYVYVAFIFIYVKRIIFVEVITFFLKAYLINLIADIGFNLYFCFCHFCFPQEDHISNLTLPFYWVCII